MKEIVRCLSAESLKLRRTLAWPLAILAPLAVVLLNFVIYTQGRDRTTAGDNPLIGFAQLNLTMWTILVLPLYAAVSAALVAAVDHQGDSWKHLLALPVSRRSIFIVKWIAAVVLLTASSLAMSFEVFLAAAALRSMKPAWRLLPIPVGLIALRTLQSGAAAVLVLSLQMWVSLRWRSFVAGLALGIAGVLVLLAGVARAGLGTIAIYLYPWALPPTAMARMVEPHSDRTFVAAAGLIGGTIIALLGSWHLSRRDVN
jgi:hypothetical protein